jgi:uncharacterized protein (DUF2147 family)
MRYALALLVFLLSTAITLPLYAADPQEQKPAAPDGGVSATAPETAVVLSPAGRWRTIDDNTLKVTSVVLVKEEGGVVTATIEKLIVEPGEDPNPRCDKCRGDKKDKPVVGMQILWDLKKDKKEWSGGTILDPDNGKTYKCYIEVIDGGKRLKVRGYLGITIFGRTQYWVREE